MRRAVLSYLVTLWAVLTLNFLLPRLMPGDPLAALLDPSSSDYVFDPEVRAALASYYGLDRPLPEQYVRYLWGAFRGDLGRSIRLNRPVADLIAAHLPWTLLLVGTALLLSSALALLGGTEAAWRRGSRADRVLVASFATYWVTVLGAEQYPVLGAMMLPKTIAYLLAVILLYRLAFSGPSHFEQKVNRPR